MKKHLLSGTGLIIIAIFVLAANLLGIVLFRQVKIDLTEEKLYTLSDGSKAILRNLPEPIRAEFYYSRTAGGNLPAFKAYGDRVLTMLREYQSIGKGQFQFEVLDPRPDTETEELAQSHGIRAVTLDAGSEPLYLGLVLKDESGRQNTIPLFDPRREGELEYDITRALYNISHPERKRIGVLSSLPMLGSGAASPFTARPAASQPWTVIAELRNRFTIVRVESDAAEIPDDLDLLLIVHPKDLPISTLYAIDQHVLHGGRLAVFVDPFCEVEQRQIPPDDFQTRMQASFSSDLPTLLSAWGLEMQKSTEGGFAGMAGSQPAPAIVMDPALGIPVRSPMGGTEQMIVWLNLGRDNRNPEEIVTSKLDNLLFAAAGALKPVPTQNNTTLEPLFYTSDRANLIADSVLKFGATPESLLRDYTPGTAQLNLGYKISGSFRTAFPNGPPAADGTSSQAVEHAAESLMPTTIVVIADVDVLSDDFSVEKQNLFGQTVAFAINDNLNFAYNLVENLTGSQELIALRSRGVSQRPFTRVAAIQSAAQQRWLEQERALNAKLDEANRRLSQLQQGSDTERRVLDEAYMREVERFRQERLNTQRELRAVRRHLREDIERLEFRIMFINIILVPLAVALFGSFVFIRKQMKR